VQDYEGKLRAAHKALEDVEKEYGELMGKVQE
jgi:hypothetical protein